VGNNEVEFLAPKKAADEAVFVLSFVIIDLIKGG
jgi:hypothetical protein